MLDYQIEMNDLDNNRLRLFSLISLRYTAIHAFLEDRDIVFLEQYLAWLDRNPNPPRAVLELNIFYLIQRLNEIWGRDQNLDR